MLTFLFDIIMGAVAPSIAGIMGTAADLARDLFITRERVRLLEETRPRTFSEFKKMINRSAHKNGLEFSVEFKYIIVDEEGNRTGLNAGKLSRVILTRQVEAYIGIESPATVALFEKMYDQYLDVTLRKNVVTYG